MPDTPTTQPKTSEEALQWCISARKLLKLGLFSRDKLHLKSRATKVRELLQKLDKKTAGPLQTRFLDIAGRLQQAATDGNQSEVALLAERLNVLEKELRLAEVSKVKSSGKEFDKATTELQGAKNQLARQELETKTAYENALRTATELLRQLQPMKYAAPQPLVELIEAAKALVATTGSEDWSGGLQKLSGARELFNAGKQAAEDLQADALRHAGQQQHYESKQRKIAEVLQEIGTSEAVASIRKKLERAAEAGKLGIVVPTGSLLDAPLYDTGYQAILKLVPSTSKLRKAALKAQAQAQLKATKDREISEAADRVYGELAKLNVPGEELVGDDEIDAFEERIAKAVELAGTEGKKPFGLQMLQTLQTEIQKRGADRQKVKDECNDLLGPAEQSINALLYAPTPDEREALRQPLRKLESARTLLAAGEFDDAAKLFKELEGELGELTSNSTTTPDKLQARWQTESAKGGLLPTARTRLKQLQALLEQNAVLGPDLKTSPLAVMLGSELDKIERMGNEDEDWIRAVTSLTQISKEIDHQLQRQTDVGSFLTERNRLSDPVATEIQRCEAAIEKLAKALEGQDDTGSTLALARSELAALREPWEDRKGRATNAKELDAPTALKSFSQLANRLEARSKSPQAVARAIQDGREDAARKALDALALKLRARLDVLEAADADVAGPLGKRCTEIGYAGFREDIRAPGGPMERMEALQVEIEQAIQAAAGRLTDARRLATVRQQEVALQIKTLKENAAKSLGPRNRKLFDPFFATLEREILDLGGMVASPSVRTIQASMAEWDKLARRATRLQQEVDAQPKEGSSEVARTMLDDEEEYGLSDLFSESDEPGAPAPNFRLVLESVRVIAAELKDKNLARCLPVQKLGLDEDFQEIQGQISDLEPEQAFERLKTFHVRVRDTLARAARAAELRESFKTTALPAVMKQFSTLSGYDPQSLLVRLTKLRSKPGAYVQDLERRINAARALINEPQKEQKAHKDLEAIAKELADVMSDENQPRDQKLLEKETSAQAQVFQREKEKIQWKALVKDFRRMDQARAKKAVDDAPGGDPGQLKDLEKMLKQAEQIFDDTANFVGAVELLDNARKYAQRIISHPQGLKAAARDQLPKVRAHWKQAVADFNNSVDAVIASIHEANEGPDLEGLFGEEDDSAAKARERQQEAVRKSVTMLAELKKLFNANVMDAPIAVLANDQSDAPDKRAARETAMKYVNDYRDVIRTDPVLLKMMQKDRPFGTVDFYGLNAALRDLDLNIQRAA